MDRVLFFCAGGEAFWWSLFPLVLLLLVALQAKKLHARFRFALEVGLLLSGACIFLGGPPVAAPAYVLFLIALLGLLLAVQPRYAARKWPPPTSAALVAGVVIFLAIHEWPYRHPAPLPSLASRNVYVIGDSLSAGIGSEARPWPKILSEDSAWMITNLAVPGAQLSDAIRVQAPDVVAPDAAVILMIGGNDLVKRADPADFERQLDELIGAVAAPNRLLVMVELPAIPGYRRYPRAQRETAERHGVHLIPRRFLAGVFLRPGATLDGLHFSDGGHQAWAALFDGGRSAD